MPSSAATDTWPDWWRDKRKQEEMQRRQADVNQFGHSHDEKFELAFAGYPEHEAGEVA